MPHATKPSIQTQSFRKNRKFADWSRHARETGEGFERTGVRLVRHGQPSQCREGGTAHRREGARHGPRVQGREPDAHCGQGHRHGKHRVYGEMVQGPPTVSIVDLSSNLAAKVAAVVMEKGDTLVAKVQTDRKSTRLN